MSRASQSNPYTRKSFKNVNPLWSWPKDWAYYFQTARNRFGIATEQALPGKRPRILLVLQGKHDKRATFAVELTQMTVPELNSFYLLVSKAHELALSVCEANDLEALNDDGTLGPNNLDPDEFHRISSASWASGLNSQELLQRLADASLGAEPADGSGESSGDGGVGLVEREPEGDVAQDGTAQGDEREGVGELSGLGNLAGLFSADGPEVPTSPST